MFVDEVSVALKAGDGGDGCVSFLREKYKPKGGPNGGNGARGGSIVLRCDENTADLIEFYYTPHAKAKNGEPGRGKTQHGKRGPDKILKVPPGLIVRDEETDEVVCELLEHGQEIILLKGGEGGLGNNEFKNSVDQAPRKFTKGEPGGEGRYRFVLKTIADAGMVGLPNAGKSSLVNSITMARPKTGAYPFTTVDPSVGIIDYPEHYDRRSIADIPGLIAGAHANRGLGHRFLRHIERCRCLCFIIDFAGVDERNPLEDYETLLDELSRYNEELLAKPRLVLANKIDLPAATDNLNAFKKKYRDIEAVPMSCRTGEGLDRAKERIYEMTKVVEESAE